MRREIVTTAHINLNIQIILNIIHIIHTWGEDIWVEANVKRSVADGAHCFTGIEDDLTTFGICYTEKSPKL